MAIIKDRVKKKKKRQITSSKEDGETLGPLSIPGGNVKWCSHFGKQSKESSSNSETELTTSKRRENMFLHKNLYTNVHATLFIMAPTGKNPNVH